MSCCRISGSLSFNSRLTSAADPLGSPGAYVAGPYLRFDVGKLGRDCSIVQFSALVSAMGWTNEMALAKVLCSLARPVSTDDALAVLEPFAAKVAWTVLWGGGGSNAVSLPA
jgi:hypothetical protein